MRVDQFADVSVVHPVVHFNASPNAWNQLVPGGMSTIQAIRKFNSLYTVIDELARLPAAREDAVDADTATDAANVLSLIQQYNVPPPTIFSHGGDAVVFNWDMAEVSRYLTVSDRALAILDIHRITHEKCPYPIIELEAPELEKWLQLASSPSQGK